MVDSHSKKRPHNLIFGRMFDHRLYDLLEVGVEKFRSIKSFGTAGASVQAGNKVWDPTAATVAIHPCDTKVLDPARHAT